MISLGKIHRLYHTVKPLRWEQLYYRMKYRFSKPKQIGSVFDSKSRSWPWQLGTRFPRSYLGNGEFVFLNKKGYVKAPEDWNSIQKDKLWLYNLHYFDDLNAADSSVRWAEQLELILNWIDNNPVGHGNGWEPYTLSLRLVNWIKWCNRIGIKEAKILASINQQVLFLSQRLEYHLLANHLFANAKALLFSGAFLEGPLGQEALQLGLSIFDREMTEQFLEDGGHFELSPMYHSILLEDLLDVYQLVVVAGLIELSSLKDALNQRIQAGLNWLGAMVHPDGEISFFNDSSFGVARSYKELVNYALELGIKLDINKDLEIRDLRETGYISVSQDSGTRLIVDAAEVGPNYQPGHAHADTLSFELSVNGHRVFVNSGTSEYGLGGQRELQRATQSHNTLVIGDRNSSDVWSGFRVGQRAKILSRTVTIDGYAKNIMASHDGYSRFRKPSVHQRSWHFLPDSLHIVDVIDPGKDIDKVAYFYLHPDVNFRKRDSGIIELEFSNNRVLFSCRGDALISVSDAFWFRGFGDIVPNKVIKVSFTSNIMNYHLDW